VSLMPQAEGCQPGDPDCMCSCHRVPGIVHVAACCGGGAARIYRPDYRDPPPARSDRTVPLPAQAMTAEDLELLLSTHGLELSKFENNHRNVGRSAARVLLEALRARVPVWRTLFGRPFGDYSAEAWAAAIAGDFEPAMREKWTLDKKESES
jgi:hypothetical protein